MNYLGSIEKHESEEFANVIGCKKARMDLVKSTYFTVNSSSCIEIDSSQSRKIIYYYLKNVKNTTNY